MKVALIELGGSHEECLYAQIKYLKALKKIEIDLWVNKDMVGKVAVLSDYAVLKPVVVSGNFWKQWREMYRLWLDIRQASYDYVILNTAQGGPVKKLLSFPLGRSTKWAGTLHNIRKLSNSLGQKLISYKLDKYFVLGDYLLDKIDGQTINSLQISSYYPIEFPITDRLHLSKPTDEIWICIPGQVELKRRDYEGLLSAIEKVGLHPKLKFILLGRAYHAWGDGELIESRIKAMGLEDHFLLWKKFIPEDLFYSYVQQSDYIMPLIHKEHYSFELYKYQISGSFNLGFGFKKPFILQDYFSQYEDFRENSLFYSGLNMMELVNGLTQQPEKSFFENKKWTFEYQKENYVRSLIN